MVMHEFSRTMLSYWLGFGFLEVSAQSIMEQTLALMC